MKFKTIGLIITSLIAVTSMANAQQVLKIKHWQTTRGTDVYFVAAPQLPIIDIKVAYHAGASRDGNNPGIAALTNHLLDEGTKQFNADQIAEQFDNVGAIFSVTSARDMAIISLRSLTEKQQLNSALDTFTNILAQVDFPQAAVKREKANLMSQLARKAQSPSAIAQDAFYKALYRHHPYGNPILGTKDSLNNITRDDIKRFYKQYYVAQNAVIAIVGATNKTNAMKLAERFSRSMPQGKMASKLPKAKFLTAAVIKKIKFPANQTNVRIGQVGISRYDKDLFPLMVGNQILGGGTMVSRLHQEIREKRGLSYAVYSTFIPMSQSGPFVISLGTRNKQANQAIALAKSTLQQYIDNGPTEKELTAAKQYITGSFVLDFSSNNDIANALLPLGFYQLPLDYYDRYIDKVNAVSAQQIQEAFAKHVKPNKLVTISVGKQNHT